jgi:phosphatidylinositol alpha 1,6-mannosyltransferase
VVVGYVGSLHKKHGVRRLSELADLPNVRLVVIGDGPERSWLEKKLPDARFTGPLETGDLTIAVPTLDLLVHPGEHETDCHALREAGASGVPVVAARAGGAPDVVRHLETGLLFDPADKRDLRRAVAAVAADKHRRLLGAAGRELVTERTWTDAVDELLAHYPSPAPLVG